MLGTESELIFSNTKAASHNTTHSHTIDGFFFQSQGLKKKRDILSFYSALSLFYYSFVLKGKERERKERLRRAAQWE